MTAFGYARPAALDQALALYAEAPHQTRPLAGGTDLLVALRDGGIAPCLLLDLSGVAELRGIERSGDRLRIGAATTYRELLDSALLAETAPLLLEAARQVGSPQIRNQGTIGGNLANASPAGDLLPPLYVLEATITLRTRGGERELPIERFISGVRRTALAPGELVTAVSFDARRSAATGDRFFKHGPRSTQAIALVNVALCAEVTRDGLRGVRLALGCVAPTVVRARATEQALAAAGRDAGAVRAAAAGVAGEIAPIDDLRGSARFRRRMAVDLVAHCALDLLQR